MCDSKCQQTASNNNSGLIVAQPEQPCHDSNAKAVEPYVTKKPPEPPQFMEVHSGKHFTTLAGTTPILGRNGQPSCCVGIALPVTASWGQAYPAHPRWIGTEHPHVAAPAVSGGLELQRRQVRVSDVTNSAMKIYLILVQDCQPVQNACTRVHAG